MLLTYDHRTHEKKTQLMYWHKDIYIHHPPKPKNWGLSTPFASTFIVVYILTSTFLRLRGFYLTLLLNKFSWHCIFPIPVKQPASSGPTLMRVIYRCVTQIKFLEKLVGFIASYRDSMQTGRGRCGKVNYRGKLKPPALLSSCVVLEKSGCFHR